ncbi:RHS repeat-associated protein [Pseudomonas sp. BE134]|nr:RHS repeat-associated protein [Pseudomonas sp. BE134]
MIGASLPGGNAASYKYDAFGRRIEKTVDGSTTEFLWQGERLIAESADNRYRTYIYEPASFRPLVMLDGEGPMKATPFYYQLDHLGTPQELTDYSGEIVWSAKYRAYGNVAALDVAEIDNPLRFQGQYFDAETGLHYNRNRYYNPGTGRFLTPDPIKLAGGLNNYQYVPNPTGWVDPLGLSSGCPGNAGNGVNDSTASSVAESSPVAPAPAEDLDWKSVVPAKGKYKGQSRVDHVQLHNVDNPAKPQHGVFYGDGVDVTNEAWRKAQADGIKPDATGTLKVPMGKMVGRSGGGEANLGKLFYNLEMKLVPETNKIITSYPAE